MSTLDLVALLVALTVVLLLIVRVLSLRPRRVEPPLAAPPPQRTVADLVRMRRPVRLPRGLRHLGHGRA